jgi:hypothetical protein
MLVDGGWAIDVPVVEVHGTSGERADQVQARLTLVEGNASAGLGRTIAQPNVRYSRRPRH